jgi:hypothetical protein
MRKFTCILFPALLLFRFATAQEPVTAFLANSGYENEPVKSVFFFTGNWRNGVQYYDYNPSDNRGLYTLHPSDARHLGWSENQSNREFAVQAMIDAGINVINMSYWGLPGTDNWAYWSPMQTSSTSHDELFNTALGKEILIAPYIESYAPTEKYGGYIFADDFPGTLANPAPILVTMIEDLVDRYLVNPAHAQWPSKWARVYDQNGLERYLVSIIHVASNQESVTDQDFAAGFDRVAAEVFENTGIHIGFALDLLPSDSYAPGGFKATSSSTGSWLKQQNSVLAIQCFLPEIWTGISNENDLITWKRNYHYAWIDTGIPFIHDLTPGYDAHIVFPSSPVYGNNPLWRDLQSQAISDFGSQSLTFNVWNGYTEGMAGVPTVQHGDDSYYWLCKQFGGACSNSTEMIKGSLTHESLEILPNPVKDLAEIRLKYGGEHFISYELINCNGVILKAMKVATHAPVTSIYLQLEHYLPGVYFLVTRTNRSTYAKKILKWGGEFSTVQ